MSLLDTIRTKIQPFSVKEFILVLCCLTLLSLIGVFTIAWIVSTTIGYKLDIGSLLSVMELLKQIIVSLGGA